LAIVILELSFAVVLQGSACEMMSRPMLQGNVTQSRNTVGIVGYRESVFGNRVVEIHRGSPAEGVLKKGDRVVAVNGDRNCHKTRGEPGEEITLTVSRGSQVFDVSLRRIAVQNLHSSYLNRVFGVTD
jgi:C-terminal processing protease CtpA/Prc